MSDLLEQAIIDAAALKEAAIKNAENTLVEKYSQEFKDTVQKLLEQEEMAAQTSDPAATAPAPTDPAQLDPAMQATEPQADQEVTDKKDAFSDVKSAFLDGPDDELITINFDQIKSTMMEMMGYKEEMDEVDTFSGKGEPANPLDEIDPGAPMMELEEDELEEAWNEEQEEVEEEGATYGYGDGEHIEALEEVELEEEITDPALATQKANYLAQKAELDKKIAGVDTQAAKKIPPTTSTEEKPTPEESEQQVEEDIELTEEELTELEEQLCVDLKPESQGRGYMGSTTVEKQRLIDVERAAARDERATKEREEEMKKMADLVKENAQLKNLNNKMMSMLESLKEEVQKINVSNAKLLYTNKALGNVSLNERQKNAIVESISKADSVLEAKTIYETLHNAVENSEKKQEAPQTLRETLNRAQSPFVVKKTAANSISDVMAERMKALAGIKLNK